MDFILDNVGLIVVCGLSIIMWENEKESMCFFIVHLALFYFFVGILILMGAWDNKIRRM